MLVSIAIAAILAAILIVVISKAKSATQSAACTTNLRTIGTAYQLWNIEYNPHPGWIPTWHTNQIDPNTGSRYTPRWRRWYFQYLEALGEPYGPDTNSPSNADKACDRLYGEHLNCPTMYDDDMVGFRGACYSANSYLKDISTYTVTNPGNVIYLIDGYANFDWRAGRKNYYPFESREEARTVFSTDSTFARERRIVFPHAGKANALFLDGHVESLEAPIPTTYFRP